MDEINPNGVDRAGIPFVSRLTPAIVEIVNDCAQTAGVIAAKIRAFSKEVF